MGGISEENCFGFVCKKGRFVVGYFGCVGVLKVVESTLRGVGIFSYFTSSTKRIADMGTCKGGRWFGEPGV